MSSTNSALEFLQGKWRTWYKNLDVNKDGIVSRDDYKSSLGDYEKYYSSKVDEKTMERIRKGFKVYWEEVILGKFGEKDTVTEDEFIANMTKEYQSNLDGFRQTVRYMFEEIIGAADVDGNGMVNFQEFYVIFCAFGHKDEKILKRMFNDYGPTEQNEISLAAMTESWIDILVGEDPNKVNVVINAFTEGAAPGTITM